MVITLENIVLKYNLTASTIQVLAVMKKAGPVTIKQISSALGVSHRTVTRSIQSLTNKKLIDVAWSTNHGENVYQLVSST